MGACFSLMAPFWCTHTWWESKPATWVSGEHSFHSWLNHSQTYCLTLTHCGLGYNVRIGRHKHSAHSNSLKYQVNTECGSCLYGHRTPRYKDSSRSMTSSATERVWTYSEDLAAAWSHCETCRSRCTLPLLFVSSHTRVKHCPCSALTIHKIAFCNG